VLYKSVIIIIIIIIIIKGELITLHYFVDVFAHYIQSFVLLVCRL